MNNSIENYLTRHGWTLKNNGFWKKGTSVESRTRKLTSVVDTFLTLKRFFLNLGYIEKQISGVISNKTETDYVIAALQVIDEIDFSKVGLDYKILSFQPCIRPMRTGRDLENGFLRAFVNVGTIHINSSLTEFFACLESWLTVLSSLSIHVSRISFKKKDTTKAYNGKGLTVFVDSIGIGEMNYYLQENIVDQKSNNIVIDIGFGLERLTWLINGHVDFSSVFQSTTSYYLYNDELSDLSNLIVLQILSRIKPSSKKYGKKLRSDIFLLLDKIRLFVDLKRLIKYSYNYWAMFIPINKTFDDVWKVFLDEEDYYIKVMILQNAGLKASQKWLGLGVDELSNRIQKLHIERQKNDKVSEIFY